MGSRRLASRLILALPVVGGAFAFFVACGTGAVGVQQCREIENARCNRAAACGISLSLPLHEGSDVDSCIRFYNDQCLHGFVTTAAPSSGDVTSCVAAINANCGYVLDPLEAGACSFLIPPTTVTEDAGEDATSDADAAIDAAIDATVDAEDANDDGG